MKGFVTISLDELARKLNIEECEEMISLCLARINTFDEVRLNEEELEMLWKGDKTSVKLSLYRRTDFDLKKASDAVEHLCTRLKDPH